MSGLRFTFLSFAQRAGRELPHTRKDGAQVVVETRRATVLDGRGVITSVLEITRDVTGRGRAQERLLTGPGGRQLLRGVLVWGQGADW